MATVRLPAVLRPLAGGEAVVDLTAASLGSLREAIRSGYPLLADRVYEQDGRLREFVNLFIDGEDARDLRDDHALGERSEVVLLPAISGGSGAWLLASRIPIATVGISQGGPGK